MSRHRKPSAGLRSPARFWGTTEDFEPVEPVVPADDPSAMVSSLGPPPLGIHSEAGAHYLAAAYAKASSIAVALSAAAGLLADRDL
jgi:hypothetical protein